MSTTKSKPRILYIYKLLMEQTDESHYLTAQQIVNQLEEMGISTFRKTVISDIEQLIEFGVDIVCVKSSQNRYHIEKRDFTLSELKLLVDAVECSHFITLNKSAELIEKLSSLTSTHNADELCREIYLSRRTKAENEEIYDVVDTLHKSINLNKQIKFQYYEYDGEKNRVLRNEGEIYQLSPYGMTWEDGRYYVIGYSIKRSKIIPFRVDRMTNVLLTEHCSIPKPDDFNVSEYVKKAFRMYDDETVMVTLKCKNEVMKSVIDRFGIDVQTETSTKGYFNYVDMSGAVGQMDMPKEEYDLLTEKTYSPDNAKDLEFAKSRLEERKQSAGIMPKPTEYYAVRQTSERKFAICSISADGIVDVVKSKIDNVADAKKAMLEIYNKKKDSVKCELVHPQTLDEKSMEIFKNQPKELPDVTYRIKLNTDKQAEPNNTHFLQKYLKNEDDTYRFDKVVCRGDYDMCNKALAGVIADKEIAKNKPNLEIYQIKDGENARDIRFESFKNITDKGLKPEFSNYSKVYEADMEALGIAGADTANKLESVFQKFNTERPSDFEGRSLAVSDVVVMDDKPYYVDSCGFKQLPKFAPIEVEKDKSHVEPLQPQGQEKAKVQKKPKL